MTQHAHSQFVEGCYRCELSADEAAAAIPDLARLEELAEAYGNGAELSDDDADAVLTAAPSLLAAARAVARVEALVANEPGDEDEGRISKAMIRAALAPTILEAAEAARGSKLPKPMSAAALLREVAAADPAAHNAALARGYGVGNVLEAACALCGYSERYAHHHDGQAKGYHPFAAALGTEQEGHTE